MRILHIWDQSGVASIISKYQRKNGHETQVMQQTKHDNLGSVEFYGGTLIKSKPKFVLKQ